MKKKKIIIIICVILGLIIAGIIGAVGYAMYTAYSIKNSSSPVGYWIVTKAVSNDVVMTKEDAETMGYDGIGTFTLNESGSCTVVLMDEEYEGTWKTTKGSELVIDCGEGHVFEASIDDSDENIVMTATDERFIDYYLEK